MPFRTLKAPRTARSCAADAASPYFGGYTWPGNVRELENIIERIVVLARGDEITLNDLPDFLRRERPAVEALHLDLPAHGISLETVEKELIVRALDKFNGNQTHAAQYLDISRKTLIYRMEKFGLRKEPALHWMPKRSPEALNPAAGKLVQ
jgi:two-component system NtrC family response regulator